MRGGGVFAYLYICKVCVCVGLESRYACHPNLGASSPQDCHSDTQQVAMETTLIRSKTESTISRCLWGVGEGTQERLTAVLFRGRCCSKQRPWPRPVLVEGGRKQIRLGLFGLGASSHILAVRLFSSILVSETIHLPLQSCELLHDVIHIVVHSHSLSADSSAHCFNHDGQPCRALDGCHRLLNSSINQGNA